MSSGSKLTDETSFFSSSKSISIRFSKYCFNQESSSKSQVGILMFDTHFCFLSPVTEYKFANHISPKPTFKLSSMLYVFPI